jgi:hypothetical protein
MGSILKYIFLTAIRDWLYVGIFILLLAAFGISILLGTSSLVEPNQVSSAYAAGGTRMIFVVGMVLFVCFNIRRSFDNKEVEFILSKSISRPKFVISYLLGFNLVALIILVLIGVPLLFIVSSKTGLAYWAGSLFLEIMILISFAVLASLILSSAVSAVLASLGFYIISRLMGFFVLTAKIPDSLEVLSSSEGAMKSFLKFLSIIFPRLDLFAQSEWIVYGVSNFSDIKLIAIQSLVYIPLMMFMAFYDFNNKQF